MSERSEREIRESIEATRARMGETIEQIGDRVNPDRVKSELKARARHQINEAKDNVKRKARNTMRDVEHGVSDTGKGIWATIKDNPVPAGMVGVGLAWLIANRRESDDYRRYDYETYSTGPAVPYRSRAASTYRESSLGGSVRGYESTRDYGSRSDANLGGHAASGTESGTGGYGTAGTTGSYGAAGGVSGTGTSSGYSSLDRGFDVRGDSRGYTAGSQGREDAGSEGMRDKASNVMQAAGERLGGAQERVGEVVHGAQERVGEAVHHAGDRMSSLAGQARNRAREAEHRFEESLRENPVAAGAVALAIGMAAGLMIPETDREHRVLGRARERAFDKAQDAVRRSADKLHDAAREAAGESARHAVDEIWPGAEEGGSEGFSEPRR